MTVSYGGHKPGTFAASYDFEPIPGFHKDPVAARMRLVEAGVDLKTTMDAPEYPSDDCKTYCVVTLVFEATQSAQIE